MLFWVRMHFPDPRRILKIFAAALSLRFSERRCDVRLTSPRAFQFFRLAGSRSSAQAGQLAATVRKRANSSPFPAFLFSPRVSGRLPVAYTPLRILCCVLAKNKYFPVRVFAIDKWLHLCIAFNRNLLFLEIVYAHSSICAREGKLRDRRNKTVAQ